MAEYGADTTRLFILFASPPEKDLDWSGTDIKGCFRFLNRLYRIVMKQAAWIDRVTAGAPDQDSLDGRQQALLRKTHQTIDKVSRDIQERLQFNTAIAACMELLNEIYAFDHGGIVSETDRHMFRASVDILLRLLAPFVPHLAEELRHAIGQGGSITRAQWPSADPDLLKEDSPSIEVPVMVNGKLRDRLHLPVDSDQKHAESEAVRLPKIQKVVAGKRIVKAVYVPGKIINLIVK
jgi:leucyl-tRNA synthetase